LFNYPISTTLLTLLLEQIDIHKSPNFKGYTALLGENTNPENRGDLHEGFDIGWEDPLTTDSFGVRETGAMSGTNIWPAPLQTTPFKRRVLDYYYRAVSLGKALFPLFALALDLSEDYFEDKTKENAAIMRLLHYPPQTGVIDDRIQGIGAHTDYECFTILWQDSVRALQVLNTQGKWIDAVPIPGTVVVKSVAGTNRTTPSRLTCIYSIGDQFARWTSIEQPFFSLVYDDEPFHR
jgi:isopenicillin N synthase-like dioxygenase